MLLNKHKATVNNGKQTTKGSISNNRNKPFLEESLTVQKSNLPVLDDLPIGAVETTEKITRRRNHWLLCGQDSGGLVLQITAISWEVNLV
jgi:hypothetical protein